MMSALGGTLRCLEQITTEFADILKQGAIPTHDIVPEAPCRELLLQYNGAAADEYAADGDDAADAMIHRQTIHRSVGGARVQNAGEPIAPGHDPAMADIRGFR